MPTRKVTPDHLRLYLNADPDEELIKRYLPRCSPFELRINGQLIGVILLMVHNATTIEIKNLSIDPDYQHQGYGKILVQFAKRFARSRGARQLTVGTGSTSVEPLLLYQKCGFRPVSIDRDFFVINYHLPLYERGIRLRDMIRLTIDL